MLATMYLNQSDTMRRLRGSFAGSFIPLKARKNVFALLSMLMLTLGGSIVAHAQTLQASYSPDVVCEGNNAIIEYSRAIGLPAGVTVKDYIIYYKGSIENVDSAVITPPAEQWQIPVRYTPGVYHPYVVAVLSNGTTLTSNILDLTVYHKPLPFFINLTTDVQCFKGNNVCFKNTTQQAPFPSSPVVSYVWEYGDAASDSLSSNADVCHTYGFPGTFTVVLRAQDSLGCKKDTFLPPAKPIVIKPPLTPKFSWLARTGPCHVSNYLFTNATPIGIDALTSYRWEFGDGNFYEATFPFTPDERAYFDSIGHDYIVNGSFPPFISVTDTTGCTDSIRYTGTTIPKNIVFKFDVVTIAKPEDFSSRDSVCLGSDNNGVICFKQTPIEFAGPGDFEWDFDDPMSMDKNVNKTDWAPCHTFVGMTSAMGTYFVKLSISNVCPGEVITHTYTAGRTFYDNKYIDKYLYAGNDTLDEESRPIEMVDTIIFPKYRTPLWNLVYMNVYNTSEGDTLYAYQRTDVERPIIYLGDSLAINKSNGSIYDTILLQPNFMRVDSFQVRDTLGVLIPDSFDYDTTAGYRSYGYGARVIGPFARIPNPGAKPPVVVKPQQMNQCGPADTVEFVNTSLYYKSRKMYRRWDFDDNFAPQCTSFSIPKAGWPPIVSTSPADSITFDNGKTYKQIPADTVRMWKDAEQQYVNSNYYFINNGITYEGKMNCKFSYDTLPRHVYPNWDTVYRWHKGGKDFMPWNTGQYGNGPGLIPIDPADTLYWGKPVYLNPETGAWSLTQGSGPAPFGPWTRIDNIDMRYNNGQDMRVGEPITINRVPDPFRTGLVDDKGKYNIIQSGSVEPTNTISYYDQTRDETYFIKGSDTLPNSTMTFYQYCFYRTIIRCINVRLKLQDSMNNETTKGWPINDDAVLDTLDCDMEAILQLSFSRADGHGLGKSGKECPGGSPEGMINFELAQVGDFPGVRPECGQTFILMNFDSLADRFDNTPCALDGFVSYKGGTTAGGLSIPPFFATPNFQPMPWTSPSGTRIVYHYGLKAPGNRPPPADTAQGFISVGVVIGSGCKDTLLKNIPLSVYEQAIGYYGSETDTGTIVTDSTLGGYINGVVPYASGNSTIPNSARRYNYQFSQLKNYRQVFINTVLTTVVDIEYTDCAWPKCLSDTVWYHRFLRIQNLTSSFDIDPVNVRLRHVGEQVTAHYIDSVQDNIKYDLWIWGDKTATVDSFWYAPGGQNLTNGFYTNGYRRVRYNFDMATTPPLLLDSTVWPIRSAGPGIEGLKPRILADTVLAPNFPRIFQILDRTSVTDSIIIRHKCTGVVDTIANKDTMEYYPVSQIIDTALMFLPLSHRFVRTSWEAAGKGPTSTISSIVHLIGSVNDCSQLSSRLVDIGIIDTFDILNGDGGKDTLFCQDEPVYFRDSIRYWRSDGTVTSLPFNPAITRSIAGWATLQGNPYNTYQFDSADFWRQDVGDPRVIQDIVTKPGYKGKFTTEVVVPERVYWDFGDGTPIDSSVRPVHRYQKYGRFRVTMTTRDSLGGYDVCYGYLNVSVPVAKIGFILDNAGLPKDRFNCGDFADMIDSSAMDTNTIAGGLDSVKTNYWWFGDRLNDSNWQTTNIFNPKHRYRTNGSFKVKLVSESFLGCRDTTYDTVFIKGPRPEFRVGDTIGCVPFTVTIYNMADSNGKYIDPNGNTFPDDTPTVTTYFDWGDGRSPQSIVTGRRDTVHFTYTQPGDYAIYAYGSDAAPGVQNSCDLVAYPDTNNMPKIWIHVIKAEQEVLVNKDVVCKDPDLATSSPITISNNSDTTYYDQYKYYVERRLDSTIIDSTTRNGMPDNFAQVFPDTGSYRIYAIPGVMKVIPIESQYSCKITDTFNIKVVSPYPAFEIDTMETPKFKMINLSDTTLNNKYEWVVYKQGNPTVLFSGSGTNKNPNFMFDLQNDTGTFIVCLTSFASGISVAEACQDSVCDKVANNFNPDLQIPNVFSPNGDGKNDVLRIPHESVESFKITIYNRWGAKVFETTDVENYWNGKVNNDGAESPAGVYYYITKYKLRSLDEKDRTGTITLIRE